MQIVNLKMRLIISFFSQWLPQSTSSLYKAKLSFRSYHYSCDCSQTTSTSKKNPHTMLANTANRFVESFTGKIDILSENSEELILGLPESSSNPPFSDVSLSVTEPPRFPSGRPKRRASSRISDFVAAEVKLRRKDTSKQSKISREAENEKQDDKFILRDRTPPVLKSNPSSANLDDFPKKSEYTYPCCYCDSALSTIEELEQHVLTHVKPLPHVCAVCQHSFSSRETLTKHMAAHSKQRKFSCPLCPMGFSQRGKLKLHLRTHSGERPYKCSHNNCMYAAAQKGNLTVHMRAVHGIKWQPQTMREKF